MFVNFWLFYENWQALIENNFWKCIIEYIIQVNQCNIKNSNCKYSHRAEFLLTIRLNHHSNVKLTYFVLNMHLYKINWCDKGFYMVSHLSVSLLFFQNTCSYFYACTRSQLIFLYKMIRYRLSPHEIRHI